MNKQVFSSVILCLPSVAATHASLVLLVTMLRSTRSCFSAGSFVMVRAAMLIFGGVSRLPGRTWKGSNSYDAYVLID